MRHLDVLGHLTDPIVDDAPTELEMALFDAAQTDEAIEKAEVALTTTDPRGDKRKRELPTFFLLRG